MDNRMKTTIDKLEKYASTTPSKWREALEYRQENKIWLRYSQRIAMLMLEINQKQLAEMMNCSQQYISKVLKGRENLSLETLYKIEMTLGISILKENFNAGKLLQIAE